MTGKFYNQKARTDDEVHYQLEDSTTDLELIILENSDDRVFEHIVAEDSQDLIPLDNTLLLLREDSFTKTFSTLS